MDYELVDRLGQGGMGEVYLAKDKGTDSLVAFKILLAPENQSMDGLEAANRLKDEASATSAIKDSALLRVITTGQCQEHGPYIVYEYVKGGTLRHKLEKRGRQEAKSVIKKLAIPLLRALQKLHEAGIVHRDIKAENIFVKEDGSYVLGDLGLAYFDGREAKTVTGHIVGTPGYIAPELLIGKAPTPQSDLYSLGILLVEVITGKRPFLSTTPQQELLQQMKADISAAELINLGMPKNLAAVLAKCLKLKPEERTNCAKELSEQLAQVLHNQEPMAKTLTSVPTVSSETEKKRPYSFRLLAFSALLALLLILLFSILKPVSEAPVNIPLATLHKELFAQQLRLIKSNTLPNKAQCTEIGELIVAAGMAQRLVEDKELDKACLGLFGLASAARDLWKRDEIASNRAQVLYQELVNRYGLWCLTPVQRTLQEQINDVFYQPPHLSSLIEYVESLAKKEETKWKSMFLELWLCQLICDYVQSQTDDKAKTYKKKSYEIALRNVRRYVELKGHGLSNLKAQSVALALTRSTSNWLSRERKKELVQTIFPFVELLSPKDQAEICHLVGKVLIQPSGGPTTPLSFKEAELAIPFYELAVQVAHSPESLQSYRVYLADALSKSFKQEEALAVADKVEIQYLEPLMQSVFNTKKARIYLHLSKFKKAYQCCRQAITIRERLEPVPPSMHDLLYEIKFTASLAKEEYK